MTTATQLKELKNKTFTSIVNYQDEELRFSGEEFFKLYHEQDCCESVWLDDICGDLSDLEGVPLLQAEYVTHDRDDTDLNDRDHDESVLWTFYKFATVKGSVTVRWVGTSNGYYSESVDCRRTNKKQ